MPYFSDSSLKKLETCHKDLRLICVKSIEIIDFAVICGYRNKEEQTIAFQRGFSKANYPLSRHNHLPSKAVDIAPYPINFKDDKKFYELAGVIKAVAHYLFENGAISHKLKWGGEFKSLKDLPHFELIV